MGKADMTLEQNLAGARMFLNLFDLKLSPHKGMSETTPIRIRDSEDCVVGFAYVEDGKVSIDCESALGTLTAEYPFGQMTGFKDLEKGGYFAEWRHPIEFNIQGERNIKGNMLFDIKMDSDMGNHCRIHTVMTYQDPDGKDVEMKIMEDGKV